MTNAFYFGPADKPLFGIYHEPSLARDRESGVLLCYPFGPEYIRIHRSYQKLAVQLSRAGFHVLRFDYHGAGDSAGDSGEGSVEQWLEDASLAIDELRDCGGVDRVSVVGLRLGATLAALLGSREPGARIGATVLWEPVVDGKTYLDEMLKAHSDWLNDLLPRPPRESVEEGTAEVLGFPLPDSLRRDIEQIDLLKLQKQQVSRMLLVGSDRSPAVTDLSDHLNSLGVDCRCERIAAPRVWLKQDGMENALVPNESLRCIASWIDEVNS